MTDPDLHMRHIAADAGITPARDDYPMVFEKVYAAAVEGPVDVPWAEVAERHFWLREWAAERGLGGDGKRALVIGCGYGQDAEFAASIGYATTAFDLSPTAIDQARAKHPGSKVDYQVADLFNPPADWARAFDLVVEISTVQALPRRMRPAVIEAVSGFVGEGGTLIVIANAQLQPADDADFGPWALTRAEVDSFTTTGLTAGKITERPVTDNPELHRWVAEFHRPGS